MNTEFMHSLKDYLPNLLGAVIILVGGVLVAWIIASLVRIILKKSGLGGRFTCCAAEDQSVQSGYSEKLISQVVFWILITFVIAGFFQVLGLPVIGDPLINMLRTVFGYLPRLLAAMGLAVIAWMLAAGARILILNYSSRVKLDEKIAKELIEPPWAVVEQETVGDIKLSRTLGDLVYWLVILFFIPLVLDTLGFRGLLAPVLNMINKILAFLPNLIIAALILIIGYLAAKIVSRVVINLLKATNINRFIDRKGGTTKAGGLQLSKIIGYVVFILILIPIVIAALQALHLESITRPAEEMLKKFLAVLPNIFAAIALLTIAYYVGRLLADIVGGLLSAVSFDGLVSRMGLTLGAKDSKETSAVKRGPSRIIGQVVLVVVMLLSAEASLRLINFQWVG